jgi:uncharacterized membrane protein YcaP (DUF421 family)
MFDMAMPWWEFVVRAVIVYFILLLLVRIGGKRTLGQFTPFDIILVVVLGNAVQNSLIGEDVSVPGGLLLAATLIFLNWIVGWIAARSQPFQFVVEGRAIQVGRDGQVDHRALLRESVSDADFEEAMRRAEVDHYGQIRAAWLETDGSITILKERAQVAAR